MQADQLSQLRAALIQRARAYLAATPVTKSGLAKAAGLHPNTLRDMDEDGWNPTDDTLRKLEQRIPADFIAPGTLKKMDAA